jgi:hypothetical protein
VTELHHIRTVPVELELSEGQLFGRLVPYGVVAQVADLTPSGDLDIYDEGFRKGAFARQAASTEPGVLRRVALRYEHDNPLREGVLISLEERDDGAYGEFMILPSYRNNWRALYDAGINELSVEFVEQKGGTSIEDDVRWRTNARLVGTALVARGAYGAVGAEVLSMRSLDEILAEQQAEREAAKERAAAEAEAAAAEVAAAEAAVAEEAAAQERKRALAEVEAFLAEARERQADLAERYSA